MDKKSTLILISILHICILGICILTIYSRKNSDITVAHVSSDTRVSTPAAPEEEFTAAAETETTPESETATVPEPETAVQTEPETTESADTVSYTFDYIGKHLNLNIRSTPSMKASIIGKVPIGGSGRVLELTNDEWALVDYNGKTGYCSMEWLSISPDSPGQP